VATFASTTQKEGEQNRTKGTGNQFKGTFKKILPRQRKTKGAKASRAGRLVRAIESKELKKEGK